MNILKSLVILLGVVMVMVEEWRIEATARTANTEIEALQRANKELAEENTTNFYRGVYATCRVFAYKSGAPKASAVPVCQKMTLGALGAKAHEVPLEGFNLDPQTIPDVAPGTAPQMAPPRSGSDNA